MSDTQRYFSLRKPRPKSDDEMLALVDEAASESPSMGTKTGCAIQTPKGMTVLKGWNDLPAGVRKRKSRISGDGRHVWLEHAERAIIAYAARNGIALDGATMYLRWFPCSDYARAIVNAGIKRLVASEPDWNEDRYRFKEARTMLEEGGVTIDFKGSFERAA